MKALVVAFLICGLIAAIIFRTPIIAMASPIQNDNASQKLEHAIFGMGCFWKSQYVFSKVPGVVKTTVGYSGGTVPNPSYPLVCTHTTGHVETVLVEFDPTKISYRKLLEIFWNNHDPTTPDRQGPDIGNSYRSVIFYASPEQQKQALKFKEELEKSHHFANPIVTKIEAAKPFYPAEDYHQNYYAKHGQTCY